MELKEITNRIFSLENDLGQFQSLAIDVFRYQYEFNPLYQRYVDYLSITPKDVDQIELIPFLPIEFFKSNTVISGFNKAIDVVFESSGTTGQQRSKHFVIDEAIYQESFITAFEHFYADITDYCVLALLPSYKERSGSSLIYMVDELIQRSCHPDSGYYLYDHQDLYNKLVALENSNQRTLLLGVSFGLLDFCEKYELDLKTRYSWKLVV